MLLFDILRRILNDYFRIDTHYVMNITDIDDKIITRGREVYLLKKYKPENIDILYSDIQSALKFSFNQIKKPEEEKKLDLESELSGNLETEKITKIKRKAKQQVEEENKEQEFKLNQLEELSQRIEIIYRRTQLQFVEEISNKFFTDSKFISSSSSSLSSSSSSIANYYNSLLAVGKEVLGPFLAHKSIEAKEILDWKVFEDHAKYYEQEFMKDMRSLNVRPVDKLMRVSEHIDSIIEFINQIIIKGFAYVTEQGNVILIQKNIFIKDLNIYL